ASENSSPGQYDILIDARYTIDHLTLTDITELVDVMIERRNSFRSKLAILTRPGPGFDHAKFMELYAHNRAFNVAAFQDFEEAMNWLMTSTEAASSSSRPAGKAI